MTPKVLDNDYGMCWIQMPFFLYEGELRHYTISNEMIAWCKAHQVRYRYAPAYHWCLGIPDEEALALFILTWNVAPDSIWRVIPRFKD